MGRATRLWQGAVEQELRMKEEGRFESKGLAQSRHHFAGGWRRDESAFCERPGVEKGDRATRLWQGVAEQETWMEAFGRFACMEVWPSLGIILLNGWC